MDFWTWISVCRPLEPVLWRKSHVDFESAIQNAKAVQPEGKTDQYENYTKYEKTIYKKCLGPCLTIFGDMKAIKSLYCLTRFLTLDPPGKLENEGNYFFMNNQHKSFYAERFPRIWTKLCGNSSYKPPGASYTAQGPQKQPEIIKRLLFISLTTHKTWIFGPGFRFADLWSRFYGGNPM